MTAKSNITIAVLVAVFALTVSNATAVNMTEIDTSIDITPLDFYDRDGDGALSQGELEVAEYDELNMMLTDDQRTCLIAIIRYVPFIGTMPEVDKPVIIIAEEPEQVRATNVIKNECEFKVDGIVTPCGLEVDGIKTQYLGVFGQDNVVMADVTIAALIFGSRNTVEFVNQAPYLIGISGFPGFNSANTISLPGTREESSTTFYGGAQDTTIIWRGD